MFYGAILKPNQPHKLSPGSLESPVLHISNAALDAKDDKVTTLVAKVNGKSFTIARLQAHKID